MSLSPAPVSPARPLSPRRLHLGHFAFMRAVVQGLDHGDCWRRYLAIEGEAGDARVVRSTLRWIREALVRIALQTDRFQLARLLQLDVQTLGTPDPALPSLAAFAEAQGLEDEPEAVQIAAFEAAHGRASRRLQRRQRLVRRQLDALRWLELQGAQVPQAADAVRAWFAPALAGHLEAAGLLLLGQLAERINAIGGQFVLIGGQQALQITLEQRVFLDGNKMQPRATIRCRLCAPCGPGGQKVQAQSETGFNDDEVIAPSPA